MTLALPATLQSLQALSTVTQGLCVFFKAGVCLTLGVFDLTGGCEGAELNLPW